MRFRKLSRATIASLCAVTLVSSSCGGESGSGNGDSIDLGDDVAPRSGSSPWESELKKLRDEDPDFDDSAGVGALPASSWTDDGGAAHYAIPLDVAPGPNGHAPTLSLSYSSSSGNGAYGVGFSVSGTPSVARCQRTLATDGYYEELSMGEDDPICYGGQRLVLESGQYGEPGSMYRVKADPSKRFFLKGSLANPSHGGEWILHTAEGSSLSFQAIPGPFAHWPLTSVQDRFGNLIHYTWTILPDHELLLESIEYGGTGGLQSTRKVVFQHEERPDTSEGYIRGEIRRQTQRVREILVEGPDEALLSRYELSYEQHPHTRQSILTQVTKFDAKGVALPPTTFEWFASNAGPIEDGAAGALSDEIHVSFTAPKLRDNRTLVVGDYDGDGTDEILTYQPENGGYQLHGGIPGHAVDVTLLAGEEMLVDPWDMCGDEECEEGDAAPTDLHRVKPHLGLSHLKFSTADRRSQLLAPTVVGDNEYDAWGVSTAEMLRVALPVSDWSPVGEPLYFDYVDFPMSEPIYSLVPLEYNGDGRDDLFFCQGDGYKTSHWRLALSKDVVETGEYGWDFYDTGVGCSIHDETTVLPHERGTEVLAVIPRFPTEDMEYPSDFNSPADYQAGVLPISESQRNGYQVLEFDPSTGDGSLASQSVLPRDLYQRWTDLNCDNGYVADIEGAPLLGAGLSRDRAIDVDGDGNRDIVRFELEGGDTHGNIVAIQSETEDQGGGYSRQVGCSPDAGQLGVLRVYRNTGDGYVSTASPAFTFAGSPHHNLFINWYGAQLTDWNADGLTDILIPSDGDVDGASEDEDWTVLLSTGDGGFMPLDVDGGLPWPHFIAGANSTEIFGAFGDSRTFSLRRPWGNVSQYFIRRGQSTEVWYSRQGQLRPVLTSAEDGQGLQHSFGMNRLHGRPLVTSRSINVPGTGLSYDLESNVRTWEYEYSQSERDRYGMRDIGFRWVRETYVGPRPGYQWDRSTELRIYDYSYDAQHRSYPRSSAPSTRETAWVSHDGGEDETWHIQCSRTQDWSVETQTLPGGEIWQSYPAEMESFSLTESAENYDRYSPSNDLGPGPNGQCDDFASIDYESLSTSSLTRDDYGNVVETSSAVTIGVTKAVTSTTLLEDFAYDHANWVISTPQRVTTTSCSGPDCKAKEVQIYYQPGTNVVSHVTREPGSSYEQTTSFSYEQHGNIDGVKVSTPSEGSRLITTLWDEEGVTPLSTTNELGHTTHMVFDATTGLVLATVDPNGLTAKAKYDGFFRPTGSSFHRSPMGASDGADSSVEYHASVVDGAVLDIVASAQGQETVTSYDRAGRVVRELWHGVAQASSFPVSATLTGPEYCRWYEYNALGSIERSSEATASCTAPPSSPQSWSTNTYEPTGRFLGTQWYDGATQVESSVTHVDGLWHGLSAAPGIPNLRGHATISTDPENNQTTHVIDAIGRVTASIDAAGTMTCFDYGPFGESRAVHRNCEYGASGSMESSTYTYDAISRLRASTTPATGTQKLTYTQFDELDTALDAKLQVLDHDYDDIGRLIARHSPEGDASWIYDQQLVGALSSQESEDGVRQAFEYDDFGRALHVRHYMPALSSAGNWSLDPDQSWTYTYSYDSLGRLAGIEYPAFRVLTAANTQDVIDFEATFDYDGSNHLRSIQGAGRVLWALNETNAAGLPMEQSFNVNHQGGVQTKQSAYFPFTNRVDEINVGAGGKDVQRFDYEWTPAGNLQRRAELLTNQEETFDYDALHRLTEVDGAVTITYDALGNITHRAGIGDYAYDPATGRLSWHGNAANTVVHDDNGNVSQLDGVDIDWTALDKVRTLSNGSEQTSFLYGPDGSRALRYDNADFTLTVGGLFEYSSNFNDTLGGAEIEARYSVPAGDGAVVEVRKSGQPGPYDWEENVYYQYNDHLGSGSVLVRDDGSVEEAVSFNAWGEARDWLDWSNSFDPGGLEFLASGFTGHQPELDTGLINMRGRMYSPTIGRFLSVDPVVESMTDAQTWNAYSYVQNNPLRYTDPSGFSSAGCNSEFELPPCAEIYPTESPPEEGRRQDSAPSPNPDGGPIAPGGNSSGGGDGGRSGAGGSDENSNGRTQRSPETSRHRLLRVNNPGSTAPGRWGGSHRALVNSWGPLSTPPTLPKVPVPTDFWPVIRTIETVAKTIGSYATEITPLIPDPSSVVQMACVACSSAGALVRVGATALVSAESAALGAQALVVGAAVAGGVTAMANTISNAFGGGGGGGGGGGAPRIYRAASGTPTSMTPRARDTGGLSAANSLENALPGKNQIIDTSKLKNLCATCDNPKTGHVSITPKDPNVMQEWIDSRGSDTVHPLTQELLDAVVDILRK